MARMKDIKTKCENKLNILKERFRIDKSGDQTLKLPYDTTQVNINISATKDFCSEMRRIGSFGFSTYSIYQDDKKKKKSLSALASLFNETSSKFPENDPKRGPLNFSALGFVEIINFTDEFRRSIESQVMKPLENLEKICMEIHDFEKRLHLLKREIGSMVEKHLRFEEQTPQDEQKISLLRDQIVVSQSEYDNLTDLYIQKVLTFEASNFTIAESLQDMILLRTEYHKKCSKYLLELIPKCNNYMESKRIPLSFGTPLENHLRETKRFIAYPIEYCVKSLSDINSLQQEGLFRVSGSINKANLLCNILNLMKSEYVDMEWPPHVVADALKRYLREMPVSLLGKISYSDWDMCYEKFKKGNKQEAYNKIKELLEKLPKSYFQNIEYLIRFLNRVVQEKNYNLMGISNISMVFVPNLFKSNNADPTVVMENNSSFNFILESLLQDTNFFFPHSDQIHNQLGHNFKSNLLSCKSEEKPISNVIIGEMNNNKLLQSPSILNSSPSSPIDRNHSVSRSQFRREQLKHMPFSFEEVLENDNLVGSPKFESQMSNPPVPPRQKAKKT